jgi:hypothetical protein
MVDLVLESSRRLKHRLGKKDQNTMAQYLETLSSVEKQIEINEAWLDTPLKKVKGSKPMLDVDPKEGCENYIKSMFDLMALGFHMDLTRVMTFQMAREDGMGFGDAYPVLASGAKKGHHGLSHSKDMEGYTEWSTHDAWLAERFAGFLKELKTREDEHGSLLDNTQVLFGSSQTHTHNASDMPLILAGGKNMGLKHGHYERFPEKVHMTNLLVSMAQAAGLDCDRFADSNGTCPGKTFS